MKIGIISDTHGFLDPTVREIFNGVEHILHAGDVGPSALLHELAAIAPVTAVLGNTDTFLDLREIEMLQLADRKFLVQHIVDPASASEFLANRMQGEPPDVVVFGHTHKACRETIGRTLFLNPGYAGRKRFKLPRSVALLHCSADGIEVEFRVLED
jgi:hypothetical protein